MAEQKNLSGWERATSIATGLAAIGMGIRKGGLGGWLGVAAGVLAAKRGLTGHCAMKAAITGQHDDLPEHLAPVTSPGPANPTVAESRIDHALEETFPASDPISP
ncbi:YgaP family membrane protein [Pseudomonas nitroreducens]|uniref:YgaP family membrane protein n=1 Tax=Pseudomonas TaxID=286 RepID=UPI00031A9520|nr:DUF2892 domain-containing protein [Pseudomonas nitroreducens]